MSVGVELAFLGTGSAQPSKYRKVMYLSGIYTIDPLRLYWCFH